jgi:tRNA G18 (ribose-2'-O)-methylase SpoU
LSGQLAPIHREAIIPGVPSVLVYELGHEQSGIPPEANELLDVAVEIPMI